MRKGRYRFQMIEEEKLTKWAEPLASIFETWQQELRNGHMAPWEFVARYLLIFVFLHRPQEKWPRPRTEMNLSQRSSLVLTVQNTLKGVISEDHLSRWIDCCTWVHGDLAGLRGVPDKVLRSLRGWRDGHFDLFLLHYVPTAHELLTFQTRGQRCVTALVTADEIKTPVETGRDVWSFCLHDLLHASHFFADAEQNYSQRYLAQFFLQAWQHSQFQSWLKKDPQLTADFIYVAADMNAHPVYIFMSFYAKLLEFFKRENGYLASQPLVSTDEQVWREHWEKFLFDLTQSTEALRVLGPVTAGARKLNTDKLAAMDAFLVRQGQGLQAKPL